MINGLKKTLRIGINAMNRDNYPKLIKLGAVERPNYAYIVYQASDLARRLGLSRISVLEFGVAGGRGLLNLEYHAKRVGEITGVKIDVYGFDTGEGLPPPLDYRDLPYIWQAAHFKMDQAVLRAKLDQAKLVLGLVADTVKSFVKEHDPAPIGAISFDLDYYSSTIDAFGILDTSPEHSLPRIFCYFDDIYSSDLGHVGPSVGVPLAIAEFNAADASRQLSQLTHLEFAYGPSRAWHRQIFSFANFKHPLHDQYIVQADRQLAL
jgi:hypothetical protein